MCHEPKLKLMDTLPSRLNPVHDGKKVCLLGEEPKKQNFEDYCYTRQRAGGSRVVV